MSLASADTAIAPHGAPKAACLFLAKFDVKEGYTLVWSSTASDLAGVEYSALPSGIHEYDATTVYLTHELEGKLHYGLARFRQQSDPAANDRLLVKMYALGVLMEPLKGSRWAPHGFSVVGHEHVDALDAALLAFMKDDKMDLIRSLSDRLTGLDVAEGKPGAARTNHPLNSLPAVLALVGPLIFPIFKAALLRKRIMIFNHASGDSDADNRDPAICGALAYLVSIVSVVPKDVRFEQNSSQPLLYSQPLYTVGLQDLDKNRLDKYPGYIASTSDEILKYQRNLFDVAVVMPTTPNGVCQVFYSSDMKRPVRATFNDYAKFLKLFRRLPLLQQQALSDDGASIKTSSSIFSALRLAYGDNEPPLEGEPGWWLQEATSPMSWREYIWLAFSWFASAGTTNRDASTHGLAMAEDDEPQDTFKQQMVQLTSIVGRFHKLSKKWFYFIDEIVSEALEESEHRKVSVELTYQDIVDMELDPYSSEDLTFVREFVLLYWPDAVGEVEIGLGVHGFCC